MCWTVPQQCILWINVRSNLSRSTGFGVSLLYQVWLFLTVISDFVKVLALVMWRMQTTITFGESPKQESLARADFLRLYLKYRAEKLNCSFQLHYTAFASNLFGVKTVLSLTSFKRRQNEISLVKIVLNLARFLNYFLLMVVTATGFF